MTKFKTVLLVMLVTSSLVLASMLILGQPSFSVEPEEQVWFGPEPVLYEVSKPSRIYIVDTNEIFLVHTFSEMYDELVATFAQIELGSEDVWTSGQYRSSLSPGIVLRYDYQISRGLLASYFTTFYESDFPFASVDIIHIPLDRGPIEFINSATGEVWQLHAQFAWGVLENALAHPRDVFSYNWVELRPGENYTVVPGVYQLAQTETMVVPNYIQEELNHDALIRSFYLEPVLIQEADGTEIYTDGFQALRIFPSGAVEYSVGSHGRADFMGQAEYAKKAMGFVSTHGGWVQDVLLTHVGGTPEEYRMEYVPYNFGIPVLGRDSGLTLEFLNGEVNRYRRSLVMPKSDSIEKYVEINPLSQLLTPLTQAGRYVATLDSPIHDLALAYYHIDDGLVPVWRVWVGGQIILIGAEDGRILEIKSTSGGE